MKPYLQDADVTLYHGDALETLRGLPDESVDCCVTSPPYWGLRDYRESGQLGLEATPEEYVAGLVEVFQELRRVLAMHGTLWLNLGDSYAGSWGAQSRGNTTGEDKVALGGSSPLSARQITSHPQFGALTGARGLGNGVKPKDLVGVPWAVAFALRADGWWLRSEIIWAKPNPMPESVTDRPTKAHEMVFLLAKQPRYFYDAEAVAEPAAWERRGDQTVGSGSNPGGWIKPKTKQELLGESRPAGRGDTYSGFNGRYAAADPASRRTRNARSVWEIATQPYPEAHFATFPEELARRCILAGCPEGGTVFDPFAGSGTTGLVARKHGRRAVLIELSEAYCQLAARRLAQQSLLAEVT